MKRRVPWFELCLLAGVALLGYTIWKSVAPKPPPIVVDTGLDPATMSPNYRYPGLVIAPVPVDWGGDSHLIASMMDMEVWKFVVKKAGVPSNYTMQLEVREKKKPPRVFITADQVSFNFDSQTNTAFLFVAILPQKGGLSDATTIKCRIGGNTMTAENPFKKYSTAGSAFRNTQPDIPLWQVRLGDSYPPSRELTLFLKIRPTKSPRAK